MVHLPEHEIACSKIEVRACLMKPHARGFKGARCRAETAVSRTI